MSTLPEDPQAQLRRYIYFLLAAASVGVMLGRILAVDSVDVRGLEKYRLEQARKTAPEMRARLEKQGLSAEEIERKLAEREKDVRLRRPFLSGNDRSRWCTVRALVEEDMRVEEAPYAIDKVIQQTGWDTIDMVKHDGHLYSSKPPLYSTILAGQYWVIHRLTGETLGTEPYAIGRTMLVLNNVLPMLVYFWLLAKLVERFGTTDWGRVLMMAAAAFGTMLPTFAVVINNHIPAAVCALIALYASIRIWFDGERGWHYFALAGFFGAMMVADELPALSLFAALSAALLWRAPGKTMLAYVPAALVVAAGFFGTNWIAHQSLRPPYAHRSETNPEDNWYKYTFERGGRKITSYWENPGGIDKGEKSPEVYALHVLVGHHGIFSLTPVWALSLLGLGIWLVKPGDRQLRELALLIGAVSFVVVAFYLTRPLIDRNYSGTSSGLRWLFWLAPAWLVVMLPGADATARWRWTRWLAALFLVVSALSASYPTWNPWTHPWMYDYLEYLGRLPS